MLSVTKELAMRTVTSSMIRIKADPYTGAVAVLRYDATGHTTILGLAESGVVKHAVSKARRRIKSERGAK